MKLYILILIILGVGCSTNKKESESTVSADVPVYSKETLSFGCYTMVFDKDSAIMQIRASGSDSVFGSLHYNRFEKDDNSGDFAGKVDSNKVVGWYKFQSEGMITVRQVVFKIIGDKLAEGYGDVNAKGDTAYFTYPHTLQYEDKHPFIKTSCPDSSTIKL